MLAQVRVLMWYLLIGAQLTRQSVTVDAPQINQRTLRSLQHCNYFTSEGVNVHGGDAQINKIRFWRARRSLSNVIRHVR